MKKLFCGIIATVLVMSVFAACGKTEDPTTTQPSTTTQLTSTTTSTDLKKENLSDYVGCWFVDEQRAEFDDANPDSLAEIFAIDIVYAHEDGDDRAVGVNIYDRTSIFPYYYSRIGLEKGTNMVIVPSYYVNGTTYRIEFVDGQLRVSDSKMTVQYTMTYKAEDSAGFDAIIDFNSDVFEKWFGGYWCMYTENNGSAQVDTLHIKSLDKNALTFDYTYGDYHGEDVVAEVRNGRAIFLISDELTGILDFDAPFYSSVELSVIETGAQGYADYIGRFDNRSDKPYSTDEKNYNFCKYIGGYWHKSEDTEPYEVGTGGDEVVIKQANGSSVVFSFWFGGVANAEDVTVQIKNNVGVFKAMYNGKESTGFIRFEDRGIFLTVIQPDEDFRLAGGFYYNHTYSAVF